MKNIYGPFLKYNVLCIIKYDKNIMTRSKVLHKYWLDFEHSLMQPVLHRLFLLFHWYSQHMLGTSYIF